MVHIDDKVYWIWLQQALYSGTTKIRTVLMLYENAKEFYNAGIKEWHLCGCFSKRELVSLERYTLKQSEEILIRCNYLNIGVITINDSQYPKILKEITNPPCVLYMRGKFPDLEGRIAIGVVGTRSATPYGLEMSYKLSDQLSKRGVIIVSGGAVGIDSSAHKGALVGGSETILVMGCGINYNYLKENAYLRRQVSTKGALVSEYPPDSPSLPRNFPMRNRIISGLSDGVLVVEAGDKSGSLITAEIALEQNKDVFAVPGNANSNVSNGTNKLIKEGAKPVTCADDILEEYDSRSINVNKNQNLNKELKNIVDNDDIDTEVKENLSCNALKLYDILSNDPKNIDVLSQESGISVSKLLQVITELEINSLIKSQSGRRYSK